MLSPQQWVQRMILDSFKVRMRIRSEYNDHQDLYDELQELALHEIYL